MQKRKHWLLSALVATVAGLVLAAGCGGDDGDDGGAGQGGDAASEQTLRWGLGSEFNLDPGLATDTTSSKILSNIFDPLVKLDDDLKAQPAAAESWDVSGPNVTYHLRTGMKWTNGDPVTAGDYEFAWKRALSPELGSDYAYQLYGIKGAADYNEFVKIFV
jgi:oligopeptide transport system substrate-binding protein